MTAAVPSDLGQEELGGKATFRQVSRDPLLDSFRIRLRIQKHEHGRASTTEGRAQDSRLSG